MPKGKRFDPDAALRAHFRAELAREQETDRTTPRDGLKPPERTIGNDRSEGRAWFWEVATAAALFALAVLPAWRTCPRLGMPISEAAANGKLSSLTRAFVQDLRSVAAATYSEIDGE